MTPEAVRAGSEWLRLREPADADARSDALVDVLRGHLPTGHLEVHDLGSGTGSMARWLAPRLDGPQTWLLHDRDADLLRLVPGLHQPRSRDDAPVAVEARLDDITRLGAGELAGAGLITASALLDMFTAADVDRFTATCVQAGCPVLVTLSVVGRVELDPAEPMDQRVTAAFNAHQRRPVGRGRLLGPGAAAITAGALERAGLEVLQRPSAWRLVADREACTAAWLTGWIGAAVEQDPTLVEPAAAYDLRRRAQLASRALSVTVHHVDLLALPRS